MRYKKFKKIKGLKYDYELDKINEQSFDTTEATLRFMTIACSILNIFRQTVMGTKVKHRLTTIRHPLLAIPSSMKEQEESIIIRTVLQMKRRT